MFSRFHARSAFVVASLLLLLALPRLTPAQADLWSAPASYYSGATGTGSTLQTQLQSAMSAGHSQASYGEMRFMAAVTDADLDNPGNILLAYNRASVSSTWDSGATWNREHVWPQSLQPGSASNGTTGNLGDPHALRPLNPSINSSRGNKPFGGTYGVGNDGSGGFGSGGLVSSSFYYPGDEDAGDVARALFYSDTRYNGLTLVNGSPGSNQMGDLASLIAWNYADAPDEFERRRNHAIYSNSFTERDGSTSTNIYNTNNRNAFVDMPWVVHSIYVDQQNDTQVYVGSTPAADGSSVSVVSLGRVFLNQDPSGLGTTSVDVHKTGQDGTYFGVSSIGGATTSFEGNYNNFATGGAVTRSIDVGLDGVDTSTTGAKSGLITIDNLDITTQGGAGVGDNDADDLIVVTASVVSQRVVTASAVDLGSSLVGSGVLGATTLSTTGSDDERTRVEVANISTGSTEVTAVNLNGAQTFDAAADTSEWAVFTNFTTAGAKSGSANLAVTTAENGGAGLTGEGSYSDVQVDYTATVLDHAVASLDDTLVDTDLTLDFGTLNLGDDAGLASLDFDIFNLEQTLGFTAALDITAIQPVTGDTSTLTLDPIPGLIAAGSSVTASANLDTTVAGAFSATWEILTADESLPGADASNTLTLTLLGEVIAALLEGDYNGDGVVDGSDYTFWANRFGGTTADDLLADGNGDGVVDGADYTYWANRFGNTSNLTLDEINELFSPIAVPEPAIALMLLVAGPLLVGSQRKSASRSKLTQRKQAGKIVALHSPSAMEMLNAR
ncbi:MAG: endonuclease [Planctomycetota bacterium]